MNSPIATVQACRCRLPGKPVRKGKPAFKRSEQNNNRIVTPQNNRNSSCVHRWKNTKRKRTKQTNKSVLNMRRKNEKSKKK